MKIIKLNKRFSLPIRKGLNIRDVFYSSKSSSDYRMNWINQADKIGTEFIKCMELYDKDYDDVYHWIGGIFGSLNSISNRTDPSSYGIMFSKFIWNPRNISGLTTNELNEVKSLYGDKFIEKVKSDILNSRKYSTWLKIYF